MSQDEFTKLFNYMVTRFDELEKRMDQTMSKEDADRIYNLLDGIHGKVDTDDQERLIISHQVSRHQEWIEEAGKKIGLEYKASSI